LRINGTRFPDPSELVKMAPRRSEMTENNEESILRYSFSTFIVKILPIRLRFYAININPTSELALPIPFADAPGAGTLLVPRSVGAQNLSARTGVCVILPVVFEELVVKHGIGRLTGGR